MARPRSEAARAQMLQTTAELIFTTGLADFTIDEVARRSGVAKTTIYRHFPTKNELIITALDGATAVPVTPDTGSFRLDLIEFFASIMPLFADLALRAASLDIMAAAARDPELDQVHRSMVTERLIPIRTIFDRAQARGDLPAHVDFDTAFDFIEGPFIVRTILRPETVSDLDIETTVDRIIAALGGTQ